MRYFLYTCLCLALFSSCAEKQDFDQLDDARVRPTIEGSILYIESPEGLINEFATGTDIFSKEFNFDGFSEDLFADRVISGVITFEVENSTSKQIEVIGEFLDEGGSVLDTESFIVNQAPPSFIERRETAYGGATGKSMDIIRNTSAIRVIGRNLGDNTSTSTEPDPKIIFRSSGRFIIRIK